MPPDALERHITASPTGETFPGTVANVTALAAAAELAFSAAVTFVASAASITGRAGYRCVNRGRKAGETDEKK